MSIFKNIIKKVSSEKKEKATEYKVAKTVPAVVKAIASKKKSETKKGVVPGNLSHVLVRPHITEKAAILAEKNTYVFKVARTTNKPEVAKAVEALYGVRPIRVNIINLPSLPVFVRGKVGFKTGVRKALVTLAKGDKIELI